MRICVKLLHQSSVRMKQTCWLNLTVITILGYLCGLAVTNAGPVELDNNNNNNNNNNSSLLLNRIRRDHHLHCPIQPDPRSPHVQRRSTCPFEIQRDVNPLRIPDVIHRSHCLCESSPCSTSSSSIGGTRQPSRCMSLVSPIKVAYLDPQLKFVISTKIIHVPVACICVAVQPAGRHMSSHRNIVV